MLMRLPSQRTRIVARAPEDRVHDEQQHDRAVAAEHHTRERRAASNDVGRRAHERQQIGRIPRAEDADDERDDDAEHDGLNGGPRRTFRIVLAHTAGHERGGPNGDSHRHGVDEREHRFGQTDGRHRIGAKARHPEDVGYGKHRLHQHLEDHGYGQHEDPASDGDAGVVDRGAADRVAKRSPDPGSCRARECEIHHCD
jgi:hypothetical protein